MSHTPPRYVHPSHLPTPPPTAQQSRQPALRPRTPSTPTPISSISQKAVNDDGERSMADILRYGVPGYATPAHLPEEVNPAVFDRCSLQSPLRWSRPLTDSSASSRTVVDDASVAEQDVGSAGSLREKTNGPVIAGYFKFLQRAIEGIDPHHSAVLRRASEDINREPILKPEPLFQPSDDIEVDPAQSIKGDEGDDGAVVVDDEIEFTGRAITLALVPHSPSNHTQPSHTDDVVTLTRKRSQAIDEDDDDFEITGQLIAPKRPRTNRDVTTALRETSVDGDIGLPCNHCGCACRTSNSRGTGSGSQTLSLSVRANLLRLLLGEGLSFHQQLRRLGAPFNNWADVAIHVGATRRDFDRVRHAADWMQRELPMRMRRGQL